MTTLDYVRAFGENVIRCYHTPVLIELLCCAPLRRSIWGLSPTAEN